MCNSTTSAANKPTGTVARVHAGAVQCLEYSDGILTFVVEQSELVEVQTITSYPS